MRAWCVDKMREGWKVWGACHSFILVIPEFELKLLVLIPSFHWEKYDERRQLHCNSRCSKKTGYPMQINKSSMTNFPCTAIKSQIYIIRHILQFNLATLCNLVIWKHFSFNIYFKDKFINIVNKKVLMSYD